ncbi:N-acetyltransferase [Aquibium carbonis]|uniref:N-acetyltransferase n=1 Tax=Aquibium carbonis TaxID=2495581 RepID=A0A3S0A4N0_9HYPH|nr:N-acetyltransferase [Aquibium carbonis]
METAAGRLFADHGYPALAAAASAAPEQYRSAALAGRVLVATDSADRPVGFALTELIGRVQWLCELSVHPDHARRGVGASLVEAVADAARLGGASHVGLSTFRAVPFNAPFYARCGFAELPLERASPPLARRFQAEVPAGIDPDRRVLMLRPL